MWLWLVTGFAAVAAVLALIAVRRLRRRLGDLSESYWELRYEYTRLRSQVARPSPDSPDDSPATESSPSTQVSYVPLSSLKRGEP